jgi:hypothetical protein
MVDDAEILTSLFRVSVALCVMYIVAFLIEIYGIIGLSMVRTHIYQLSSRSEEQQTDVLIDQQRCSLVRMYLYLTGVASLLAIAAGILNGVAYFAFAVSPQFSLLFFAYCHGS